MPAPFVKWAGGKRKITRLLIETFPEEFNPEKNRYFEPFVGGGALMFALGRPDSSLKIPGQNLFINDLNPELTNSYEVIRDNVSGLIRELNVLTKNINQKDFYLIRASHPKNKLKRAARFIYLNKTCFNGLWRVNSKGEFNVPFGKSNSINLFSEENLKACSERLQDCVITNVSFEEAVQDAKRGDLVYFDPPYLPISPSANFAAYAKEGFGLEQHELLANTILRLNKKGVYVLLSNSDTPVTRKVFKNALTLRRLLMSRTISASGSKREPVFEILGMNYQHLRGSAMGDLELISRPK